MKKKHLIVVGILAIIACKKNSTTTNSSSSGTKTTTTTTKIVTHKAVSIEVFFADNNNPLVDWEGTAINGTLTISVNDTQKVQHPYMLYYGAGNTGSIGSFSLGDIKTGDLVTFEYSKGTVSNGTTLAYCDSVFPSVGYGSCRYYYNGVQFYEKDPSQYPPLEFWFVQFTDSIPHYSHTVDNIKYTLKMK